jgi:hypothetical protein
MEPLLKEVSQRFKKHNIEEGFMHKKTISQTESISPA